jgi:spore germination cell wall hydrolase CwlJ-like protein
MNNQQDQNDQACSASDNEIVARTILHESRLKFYDEYDAIAWVLFNRVRSGKFPSNAKEVALDPSYGGQFEYWNGINLKIEIYFF